MSAVDLTEPRPPLRPIVALLTSVTALMTANGMAASLIGLRAQAEGFGGTVVGLLGTVYFAGLLGGASIGGERIRAVGHIRSLAGLLSVGTATVLVESVVTDPLVWLACRAVYGVCIGGLLVVIESWLNRVSDAATRGRIMARYLLATTAGWMIGQGLLAGTGVGSYEPFVLVALLLTMAGVPVLLARTPEPVATEAPSLSVRKLAAQAPTAVVASAVAGACWGAVGAVGAVHAEASGLGPAAVAAFVAAFFAGQAISVAPLGHLGDRTDRRIIAAAMAGAGALAAAGGILAGDVEAAVLVAAVLFGATAFPLYGFAIAIAADALDADHVTGAAGALVRVNGVSAALAPVAVTSLQRLTTDAFFLVLGGVCAIAALVMSAVVARTDRLQPTALLRQVPARTSVALGVALTRVTTVRRNGTVRR